MGSRVVAGRLQPVAMFPKGTHVIGAVAYKASVDVAGDVRAGRLVRLLEDYEGEPVPISAVMPSGRHVPARVRAMVDHLAARFAEL